MSSDQPNETMPEERNRSNTVAHTSGPWFYEGKPHFGECYVRTGQQAAGGQLYICALPTVPKKDDARAELDANGRLIASAPDLLEALKHVDYLLNELADERTPANVEMTPAEAALVAFRKHTARAINRAETGQ